LTEINENESGINNCVGDNDVNHDVNDGIDTDVDNGIGNDDVNADINTDGGNDANDGINNDAADVVDGDTQTPSVQEDEDKIDETRILEALLFASDELLTPAKLKAIIPGSPDTRHIRKMAGEINERLLTEGHPFEIVEAGGGYQFRTLAAYHPYVRKLYKERAAKKLSQQALECLAIIAYRQPISKAEVETLRGVLSDGAMKTLLERKLIDLCGRSDKPGRPMLYGTTNDFLRYFGINKIGDLPRMEEFEQMARAKMEEMSADELSGEKEVGGEEVNASD
jgi:segregation and condensation protein B